MPETAGRRLPASEGVPKGLAPLRLGKRDRLDMEAREIHAGLHVEIALPNLPGRPTLRLSRRGAGHLGRWLLDWARPKATMKLWGIDGIAEKCDVSRGTVYKWAAKPDFPAPLDVLGGNGQVWEADAVKAWVKFAKPKTGRPRKQKGRAGQ